MLVEPNTRRPASAHVVVLGNEKGGSGKSTTAMHVAVALLNVGQRVATIDLDFAPEELHPLHREPAPLGQACRHRAQGAGAFLRRARLHAQARRERGDRVRGLRRGDRRGRAVARFRRRRHARHRQLSHAARAFHGRHADHAAQRQLRRFRCARHRRPDHLCGHRREPLRRDGARRAPAAAPDRRHPHGLGGRAQSALDAGLPQQAPGGRGARPSSPPG